MKRKLYLSLTALVLALTANVAFAQLKCKADVPFAFSVEQKSMDAGQYSILVTDRVIQIRNDATNESVVLFSSRLESPKPQTSRLIFHKYGDHYYLAEAWTATGQAGASGVAIPASKAEQETRASYKDSTKPETVILAMR